jgi:hypothetical protein
MKADYETVRRDVIAKHYAHAARWAKYGFSNTTGLTSIVMEFTVAIAMFVMRLMQRNHFKGDVTKMPLPA